MVGSSNTMPSSTPKRLAKEPAEMLRMMTSSGTMETFLTSSLALGQLLDEMRRHALLLQQLEHVVAHDGC